MRYAVLAICSAILAVIAPAAPAGAQGAAPGASELLRRLRESPAEAEAIIIEARHAAPSARTGFLRGAAGQLSAQVLWPALLRLQALDELAADRWVLEIMAYLPHGHELRLRGPRHLGLVWREGAPKRLLDTLSPSASKDYGLLYALLPTLRLRVKSPEVATRLWRIVERKNHPDTLRAFAAAALEGFGQKDFARKVIRQYVLERSTDVRAALLDALDPAGEPQALSLVTAARKAERREGVDETRALLRLAARSKSDEGLAILRDGAIYSRGAAERTLAVELLVAFAGHPRFLDVVREVRDLQVTEPDVRVQMQTTLLEVIAASRDPKALELLAASLADRDAGVRLAAAHLLKGFPAESTIPLYVRLLEDKAPHVVSSAIWGLWHTRRGGALEALCDRLEHLARAGGLVLRDALRALSMATGLDLGLDPAAWLAWRKENSPLADPRGPEPRAGGGTVVGSFFKHGIYSHHPLFILDVSGSMDEPAGFHTRLELLYRELAATLGSLDESYSFSVIAFDQKVHAWPEGPLPATEENVARALRFLKEVKRAGGTDYRAALEAALSSRDHDTVYFLSDGNPSRGKLKNADELARWFRTENQKRGLILHTVGVGEGSALLHRLAVENGGLFRAMAADGPQ
jgi:hypothetical protein